MAWAEPVWAVRPCSRNEEFPSQARTSWKSPSPLKVKLAPSKVLMWGSPNIQAGRKEETTMADCPGKDLGFPHCLQTDSSLGDVHGVENHPQRPSCTFVPLPKFTSLSPPPNPFPNARYKASVCLWPHTKPSPLGGHGPAPGSLLSLPSGPASALWGPSSLTGPQGPVPSTADAWPPLVVQGTEGRLVVPAAAPVPWLQLLVWGKDWHVGGRQRAYRVWRKVW